MKAFTFRELEQIARQQEMNLFAIGRNGSGKKGYSLSGVATRREFPNLTEVANFLRERMKSKRIAAAAESEANP